MNRPNRGPLGHSDIPSPEDIIASRNEAGLTQTQASTMVYGSLRAWQQWEAGDRRMHAGLWELFRLKTELIAHHAK
jgi:DNA-binding transcriptional regulator YiaG